MSFVTPTRRQFLKTVAAGAMVAGVSPFRSDVLADSPALSIIDTHTHFYDPTRKEGVPWPSPNDPVLYRRVMPEDFVKVAAPCGVVGTVVVEASPWLEDNQWLLDKVAVHPCVLGVIGSLQMAGPDFQKQLTRFRQNPLFKGIRINTPFQRYEPESRFYEDLKRFAETNLVLDINGSAAGCIEVLKIKKAVPSLRIVVEHLPRTPSTDPELRKKEEEALAELGSLPDVYAKISYVVKRQPKPVDFRLETYRESLDNLWKIFGSEKVIYGSDWPNSLHVGEYAQIIGVMKAYLATRPPEDAARYFVTNAQRAYQLEPVARS